MKTVNCVVLGKPAPALEQPPYPGELGQRILAHVSAEGWQRWLERLVIIVNENQINTSEPSALKTVEQHMLGYFFNESNEGRMPGGFNPKQD